jgi:hypothetical protein
MKLPQTVLPFKHEITTRPLNVTAFGGLLLTLELMRALLSSAMYRKLRDALGYKNRKTVQRHVESVVLMISAGGEHVDDVRILIADKGVEALGGFVPSSPTQIKDFIYRFNQTEEGCKLTLKDDARLSQKGKATIRPEGPGLRVLDELFQVLLRRAFELNPCTRATIDIDATIIKAYKKLALKAYEGTRGYQPQMAWWAEKEMWLCDEFRDGNVPAEFSVKAFIQRSVSLAGRFVDKLRLRGDSALYNEDALSWLADQTKVEFAVSADMSDSLAKMVKALPEETWQPYRTFTNDAELKRGTLSEERQCAEVPDFIPGWKRTHKKDTQPLRYIAIRVRSRQRDLLEDDQQRWRYFAVVTNMVDWDAARLLRWQREKQGTVENAHGVLKNDLGGGCMPCGRFCSNAAWWRLNALTHNLLQFLKSAALPEDMERMRPKSLRFRLFNLAGRIVRHARQATLKLSGC